MFWKTYKGCSPVELNIGSMLYNRSVMMGEKVGFVHDDLQLTFTDMNQRTNAVASFLKEKGLQKGDKIAILCKNNEHAIATFFGAAKVGVISVMVNWRLQTEELKYILSHCDAKVVVYDEVFIEAIEALKETIPASLFISSNTTPSFDTIYNRNAAEPVYETAGNDPVLMMYTSGTTGRPKGALLSHSNLIASSIGLSHTIDWRETDRFLMVAPFFHIGGIAPLMTNIHAGATMILMEDFHPVEAWKVIQQEQVTTMMTVPAMLAFLLKTYEAVQPDLSSIRNITCGASAVPAPLILAFRKLGVPVQQVYGITEYSGAVSFWKEAQHPEKFDSMGKVVMHGDIKIVDTSTKVELPQGDVGEIVITGPQVFVGYHNNEEAYLNTVIDGKFYTGDVGYFDEQGFLYVVDRLKDMIISGGENIYSAELELTLAKHPNIMEVAVLGIPNEKWGEIPRAYVVKKADAELDEADVIAFSKQHLASYKAIKEVIFVDELPRNAVGKVLKTKLEEIELV